MRKTKLAMLQSVVALILCAAMLVGTTFAWFTDEVTSAVNKIQAGTLDVDLVDAAGNSLEGTSLTFMDVTGNTDILWEPGCTFKTQGFRVANRGSLALEYTMYINGLLGDSKLLEVIRFSVQDADGYTVDIDTFEGQLSARASSDVFYLVGHMDENAGNEYMNLTLTGIGITVYATQAMEENDSFGPEYDKDAFFPGLDAPILGSVNITTENDLLTADAYIDVEGAKVTIPAGTRVKPGTTTLKLRVKLMDETTSDVKLSDNQVLQPMDVTVEGVSDDNQVPLTVELYEIAPVGLNMGSIALHHVHKGVTAPMTRVAADAAFTADNQYRYDPATGDLALHMATFSEVAVVADTENAWEGKLDYTWYDASKTALTIANADQLAALGAIVGGMAKDESGNFLITYTDSDGDEHHNDSFAGKTIKLVADINLGDGESKNNPDLIFYPIGYWNNEGTYERKPLEERTTAVSSGFYAFSGTFDGNGHTVSNFYQNTWEMKGDHNWYDPIKEQYYRDGMGLFGRVYGGTVKNLTIKNFSSDGEITTTGCVAAYADFGATFENIAIFNCNPRVYNIGNGGIVGCVGWYTKGETDKKVTFRNITVDNSNKISALWGSYDVACGGIVGQYYPTSGQSSANYPVNAGLHFENCHVSAVMDVYNDVCANYQYYAYRYTGMLIGSVRENETINGHVYPKMDGITADGCTVHFGDWNDYYYCELVANSLASYTHDHQMSRLTQIAGINIETMKYLPLGAEDVENNWVAIPTSGRVNYVVVKAKDANGMWIHGDGHDYAECYHFVNGVQHFHDVADADNPNPTETVNGVAGVLKEDKQLIYREFNQLFTGYGWGVTSKGLTDFVGVENMDITLGEHENSVEKFKGKVTELANNKVYKLGDIFTFVDKGVKLVPGALAVSVHNLDENNPVSATVVYDRTNWENGTITLTGTGKVQITIQDYYFCTPTTITVEVKNAGDVTLVDRFDIAFPNKDDLNRVGNTGAVALGKLFTAKDGIGNITVTFESISGATVENNSITVTKSAWKTQTVQFNGTGIIKVTISDDNFSIPVTQYLEVVDATNVTGLSGTISGNVVLLNDCGLSSLTVSGRNTVYGNGFTATYTGNGQYLNNGLKQGVITVSENGTLDNLRIVAPIYPLAYMYYGKTTLGDYVQGGPSSVEGDKTRYHYQLSAVAAKGKATISNCYIYGGRTNIFVDTGDVTIEDTILECGTVANVQIQSTSEYTVTLENVTTIQYQVNPTIGDTSKVMLGAGVLVGPDTDSNPTIVLNSDFKQYNWVTADDAEAVSSSTAQMIINGALDAAAYNHNINGKTASNLGVIYMNEQGAEVKNNTGLPYKLSGVKMTVSGINVNGQVCSVQNATTEQVYSDYGNADKSTVNGLYQPQFKYDNTLGDQYIAKTDDGDEFCYREGDTIYVLFPSGDTKELNLATIASVKKYSNQNLGLVITCKDENGNAVTVTGGKVSLSAAGEYTVTYTVTDTLFYDKDGNAVPGSEKYSWNITVNVALKDSAVQDARFEFDATKQKMGYYKPTLGDVKQYLPFLAGLKIYDYNGQTSYLRFDGDADFNKIASITITGYTSKEAYIEVKLTDGGVINTKFLARADSGGGSTYTGKIKTSNNTVYFVTDSGTSNKEATTTAAYWYVDYYKFTGNNGVTIQSAQQTFNSTGKSASTPSGSFSTTIKYTVTYDANSGNCGQAVGYATSASAAVTLPTPSRSGYIFSGWYTAASGGTRIGGAGDSYTPSANITLYAQWGKPCTVTYDANGGTCGTASEKYTGTALTLPTPTRDGYWFVGWYDAATGGNKIGDAGATYNPSDEITLYAHWQEKIEYTVTYNANGGTCGTASEKYTGTALKLPTPTRTGYTFNGWYTAGTGGTRVGGAGDSYTPSANITLYAQWTAKPTYTITIGTQSNAQVTVDKTSTYEGDTVSVTVSFSKSSNKTLTVKDASGNTVLSKSAAGTYTFSMPASNVTIEASSSGSCVTSDTLVTLADGTQKRIDEVTYADQLLVWDFFKGEYTVVPGAIIFDHGYDNNTVIELMFSDGSSVKAVNLHQFFDAGLNRFVDIDANSVADYVGHRFAKMAGNGYEMVTLVDYKITQEYCEAWGLISAEHYNIFVNGMLSTDFMYEDYALFNYFEVGEDMKFDEEKMQADIEKYGLYTYEDFDHVLTYEQFVAFNVQYFKIAVGKGEYTYEGILALIDTYLNN